MISTLTIVVRVAQFLITLFFAHLVVYTVCGAFKTRRFKEAATKHRYGILIAARNEEAVLGHLLDSIWEQEYPTENIRVFVVADNCTDKTAEVARAHGAVCYERFDNEHRTKGYALEFLVDAIHRDYGKDLCEAFFIFDADNLLAPDYIAKMNDAFDVGEKIITSYRHTKNFDDNWISASYGLHWIRTVRCEHRGRAYFGLATRIQGTGILIHKELFSNGWHFTSLTEDRELAAHAVADGYRISFQYDAVFYDEQPTDLSIAFRQRLRWAKGNLWVFFHEGKRLFKGIFKSRGLHRFVCYDMLGIAFPEALFSSILALLSGVLAACESADPIVVFLSAFFGGFLGRWIASVILVAYVMAVESARLPVMSLPRRLFYCLIFPIFEIIGQITMCIAAVSKVEWKPIPHTSATAIREVHRKSSRKEKRTPVRAVVKKTSSRKNAKLKPQLR